jgi:hypothetical protein
MSKAKLAKAICFLTVGVISGIGSPAAVAQVARIVQEATPEFQVENQVFDKPTPKSENGYLLAFDPIPENAPRLFVFGPAGSKIFATQLALDGAVHVVIRDIAASAKGVFAITGGAVDSAGGGINFLAYLDRQGAVTRVIRLQDFAGRRLCFTDDGRLWLAGTAPIYPGHQAPPDYDVLRVYDAAGSLQGSFLKRSLFTGNLASGRLHLAANQQSVVLFNSVTGELVETSYEGRVGRVMNVPVPATTDVVTGFAVSGASDIVVSCQPSTGVGRTRFLLLDPKTTVWSEVYSRDQRELDKYSIVLGSQRTSLLVLTLRPVAKFSWVRLER